MIKNPSRRKRRAEAGENNSMKNNTTNINFAFFGSDSFSISVLEELKSDGFIPSLIISVPDKPKGRHMIMTSPLIKDWAVKNKIRIIQPEKLDDKFVSELNKEKFELFIVASYGKIIPKSVLEIPKYGTLNAHPSLLPKWRGASPLQSTILNNEQETGTTIMLVDEKMDHGPIIAQEKITIEPWPLPIQEFEAILGKKSGVILSEVITPWVNGEIKATPQDENHATFTKKIKKEDGLIDLLRDAPKNYLKICAYSEWPGTYFIVKSKKGDIKVSIKKARLENNTLVIERVVPEGKKEMNYKSFLNGLK